jgi:hypothetical protein
MIHAIADITPNGTATALAAARKPCNWVAITAITGNGAPVRVGDLTVDSSHGITITAGTTLILPPVGDTGYLDLAGIWVYAAAGTDKVGVVYGTH